MALIFLLTVAMGLALGVFYDMLRALRSPIKDLLFWLSATFFVFFVLLHTNFAQLRFFVFLGLSIGGVLYFCMLSHQVLRLASFAKSILARYVGGKQK